MAHTSFSADKKRENRDWNLDPHMYESVRLLEGMEWRWDCPVSCQHAVMPQNFQQIRKVRQAECWISHHVWLARIWPRRFTGQLSIYVAVRVPPGWWSGWMAGWHDGSWLACTLVAQMTRELASCLGTADHTSRGLGQAMCGLSGESHSGTDGCSNLSTFATATTKATPLFLTRQGKQAERSISNTLPSHRNDHSKHRPLNRAERRGIWQTLFLPLNWDWQMKTNRQRRRRALTWCHLTAKV